MLEASYKSGRIVFDTSAIARETELLADRLAGTMIAQNQVALLGFGAKATGGTLRSIRLGTRVSTATFQRRQIIAGHGYKFIVSGRRAGAKMPIRLVGTGKRGGKIFEPVPSMLEWFNVLGIPREAWFPIMRAISRRGIQPRNVPLRALQAARPHIARDVKAAAVAIGRQLVRARVR